MSDPTTSLPPGFRFHPTDEELIHHYLRKRAAAVPCPVSIIAEVDIYKFDPWELPAKAKFGDREWYFFSPRDRKYPNGVRPNRAAASGYWKATGTDKPISSGKENIGVKKALVFYKGKPPKGLKTNWIMHEYRLAEAQSSNNYRPLKLKDHSMRLDDWVLCRIYNKGNHLQPVPPLMEQEQDDSGTEDIYLPASSQTVTQDNANPPKLHASASISDFLDYSVLSHLFDCQPELPGSDQGSILSQPGSSFINNAAHNIGGGNGSNYQLPQLLQVESPAPIVDANLKRQRPQEDGGSEDGGRLLNPLKRRNESCLVNSFSNHTQYDGPQYNLLSQPFFNQQLLLKSHLGIQ